MRSESLLLVVLRRFRTRRMRLFERTFALSPATRVLDVGGSAEIWRLASVRPRLTILNLPAAVAPAPADVDRVSGDGCRLPFGDAAFDIVFSNSVIEHLPTRALQQQFAAEAARVGRGYWIQTPNLRFPIELHMMLPLVHFLPKRLQSAVVRRFTGWQLLTRPSEAQRRYYIDHFLNELNLLSASGLRSLFPGGQIISERFLGLKKSLIAMRR